MSHPNSSEDSHTTHVLLVGHHSDFLHVAASFLRRHELVVDAICRSEPAEVQAQKLRPHVILVDLDTPGLGGLETIARARAALPAVGIIAVSLEDGSAYRKASLAAGADAVVRKTRLVTDLLPAIRRATRDRQSALTPAEAAV